jgi:hypothetical protein
VEHQPALLGAALTTARLGILAWTILTGAGVAVGCEWGHGPDIDAPPSHERQAPSRNAKDAATSAAGGPTAP